MRNNSATRADPQCGDDGCGGSCGVCSGGSCSGGTCGPCLPNCPADSCQDDGCGQRCGGSDPDAVCDSAENACCYPQDTPCSKSGGELFCCRGLRCHYLTNPRCEPEGVQGDYCETQDDCYGEPGLVCAYNRCEYCKPAGSGCAQGFECCSAVCNTNGECR